ncbi:hypothetical protein BV20DRAFT_960469 [Pilatotrama ljubarskyi]|nr:hypothetical protein BV20DRAFT_960469 [Pilatotrama ljubarskyi]
MDQSPLLSYDVLLEVGQFASRSTLSALMKTCRFLYHECGKTMVRRRVVIETIPDLASFLACLNAENGSRCRYLEHLVLDVELAGLFLPRSIARTLSDILTQQTFPSLTTLRLHNAEEILRSQPSLPSDFASLSALTSLTVSSAGSKTISFLKGLQSQDLQTVVLKYKPGFDQRPNTLESSHPLMALENFRSSLETVEVHGYEAELRRARFPERYPRVQELILNSPDCPLIAPYIHAFPDLRNLSITTVFADRLTPDNLPNELVLIDAFRRANVDEQVGFGSWTKLETVTGTAPDIYLAGLRCAIEVLYLNVCTWDPFTMVSSILRDASVTRLHLFVHMIEALDEDGLPMVFRQLSDSSLEAISLHVKLCSQVEWEEDLRTVVDHAALDYLVESLASLPVRKLHFALRCEDSGYTGEPHSPRPSTSSKVCGAQKLQDFDCNAFAQRLLSTVAAVEHVDVRFMCSRKERAVARRNGNEAIQ